MNDILQIINEEFQGEYSYLRLGGVQVSTSDASVHITFLLPEELFDHSFRSSDIEKIEGAVSEALR